MNKIPRSTPAERQLRHHTADLVRQLEETRKAIARLRAEIAEQRSEDLRR